MIGKRVCVIGLGYIGLPTASVLARAGYKVSGVDVNSEIVETVNAGLVHIVEPGLEASVQSAITEVNLSCTSIPAESEIYIICVPTPFFNDRERPEPDLSYVMAACDSIHDLIKPGDMIILESTSPVGTTKSIQDHLLTKGVDVSDVSVD